MPARQRDWFWERSLRPAYRAVVRAWVEEALAAWEGEVRPRMPLWQRVRHLERHLGGAGERAEGLATGVRAPAGYAQQAFEEFTGRSYERVAALLEGAPLHGRRRRAVPGNGAAVRSASPSETIDGDAERAPSPSGNGRGIEDKIRGFKESVSQEDMGVNRQKAEELFRSFVQEELPAESAESIVADRRRYERVVGRLEGYADDLELPRDYARQLIGEWVRVPLPEPGSQAECASEAAGERALAAAAPQEGNVGAAEPTDAAPVREGGRARRQREPRPAASSGAVPGDGHARRPQHAPRKPKTVKAPAAASVREQAPEPRRDGMGLPAVASAIDYHGELYPLFEILQKGGIPYEGADVRERVYFIGAIGMFKERPEVRALLAADRVPAPHAPAPQKPAKEAPAVAQAAYTIVRSDEFLEEQNLPEALERRARKDLAEAADVSRSLSSGEYEYKIETGKYGRLVVRLRAEAKKYRSSELAAGGI